MKICITRSTKYSYSETFIRDQIAGFAKVSDVYPIHSGRYPERKEDGSLLGPKLFWFLHKAFKIILGRNNYFSNYGVEKFLKENEIDVVLSNYGTSGAHMVSVCKSLKIPLLVIFHGHDATDRKLLKEYKGKYRKLFEYAAYLIVVSKDMKKKLIALGADPKKIHVIPCGVDVLKFTPSKNEIRDKNFLAVGRFAPKKAPLFTLQAFYKVLQKYPEAKLTMVGKKQDLFNECEAFVNKLGIQKSVIFTGVLGPAEIVELISKSFAFVQHSVTAPNGDMEGTPVSIMEASACGLPIISTFHGGIQDAVIHEKTGFLVDEMDVDKMANYMIYFCKNHKQANNLGLKGREHIKENYNQVTQLQKIYKLAKESF